MVYELTEEDSNLWRFRRISILTICPICPDLRLPLVSVKWVVWRGFEPLKIPKNRLIYHKAHLSRLAPSFGITQIKVLCKQLVERRGFEPLKIPKNQSTYHRPHLSRLAPSFGISQMSRCDRIWTYCFNPRNFLLDYPFTNIQLSAKLIKTLCVIVFQQCKYTRKNPQTEIVRGF